MDGAKRNKVFVIDESSDSDRNELKILKSKKSKKKSKSESKDRDRSRSRSVKEKSSSKKSEKSKHKKDKKSKSKSKKKRSKRKSRNSERSRSKSSDSDSLSTCSNSSSVVSFKSANDSLTKQKSPSPPDSAKEDQPARANINLIDTDTEEDNEKECEKNGKMKGSNNEEEGGNRVETGEYEGGDEEEDLALTVTAADADALAHIDPISQNKLMDEIELAFLNETEQIASLVDLDIYNELGPQKDSNGENKMEPEVTEEANSTNGFETSNKIDQISIMVQTEYHIDPDEPPTTTIGKRGDNKTGVDKAIYCNTDPLYSEKDEKLLTMIEIEKLLGTVDDQIAELNAKKKHLLSLKQDKLLKKKKIQNAVNNKNSIEFGLFDNCLTLTNKGTLRIETSSSSSSANKKDKKSNSMAAAPFAAEQRDHKEPSTADKEKSEIISKNNGHEKTIKKRGRKRRVQERIELNSSDSETDKKAVTEPEEIPQKRRKLLLDKYSKKSTIRKSYKSSAMVMEDSSDSDEKTTRKNDRKKKPAEMMLLESKDGQKRRIFIKLQMCDLVQMKEDLMKEIREKQKPPVDISQENVANEEVIEANDADDNFEVVMVSDRSSCSDNECNLDNNNHSSIDPANKSDETVDILKLLDKKHEVITEFIT